LFGKRFNLNSFPLKKQLNFYLIRFGVLSENWDMSENTQNNLEQKLRQLIEIVDIANILTEPLTASIENLLFVTAEDMKSKEASVLIRDGSEGDLRFLTAIGKVADVLKGMRVPAGKGIAGFVFSSGQPMAVADVEEEESFYAEVDRQTGYSTQTILATPLRHKGEIIGVLEYVNRIGEPPYEPFTPEEMDKAALYADAIASLVSVYESVKLIRSFSEKMFSENERINYSEVRTWLRGLRDANEYKKMLELAILVRQISERGEAERVMCHEILESLIKFLERNDETSFLSF
jgi:signal transduction protein with GAF and PtsI domain